MQDTKSKIEFWNSVLEGEEMQEGLEDDLLRDIQFVHENMQEEHALELLDILVHSLPLVEFPCVALDSILSMVEAGGRVAVHAFKGLMLLYTEHSASVQDIYGLLHALLTEELFLEECDLLLILVNDLLYSSSISMQTIRRFSKRLARIAIRTDVFTAGKILNVLSVMLNKHKDANRKEEVRPKIPVISLLLPGKENAAPEKAAQESEDMYLHELDALKDHPILNIYAREVKQNRVVDIQESDLQRALLELLN
ncbi:uncharacterized protein NEMAJ01_1570 [Nematocida major]|uniref:uncharacterized protein n=1 Tax=Nematocida major TaxID=1912982 RepID=UPI002008518A|nr:uncharacterized protein NEMAJ01_1570 [Nematocida major]KAH9386674.1 hypothetical protein NEMAJ01_1570 [Nematocida major]